jgi:hypothetical protein
MSDFIPQKPASLKVSGLGPKAQKLQALREKMAKQSGDKSFASTDASAKAKTSSGHKKTNFQRKAT